jgi:hypothetical protein
MVSRAPTLTNSAPFPSRVAPLRSSERDAAALVTADVQKTALAPLRASEREALTEVANTNTASIVGPLIASARDPATAPRGTKSGAPGESDARTALGAAAANSIAIPLRGVARVAGTTTATVASVVPLVDAGRQVACELAPATEDAPDRAAERLAVGAEMAPLSSALAPEPAKLRTGTAAVPGTTDGAPDAACERVIAGADVATVDSEMARLEASERLLGDVQFGAAVEAPEAA